MNQSYYISWFYYFYRQLYMIYKFESFWKNSEMMTSKHVDSFINEKFTSKFLLHLIFIFLSPLVHEIRVCPPFLSQFWVNDVTTLSQNLKMLRERFHKWIIHLKVPFTSDFHLSINTGTWNTNMGLFHAFLG